MIWKAATCCFIYLDIFLVESLLVHWLCFVITALYWILRRMAMLRAEFGQGHMPYCVTTTAANWNRRAAPWLWSAQKVNEFFSHATPFHHVFRKSDWWLLSNKESCTDTLTSLVEVIIKLNFIHKSCLRIRSSLLFAFLLIIVFLFRFAQFFLCPLFDESCKDREVNAVDSEHEKNLMNDAWRLFQLEKATGSPSHPFSKFGTGVVYTLKPLIQDASRRHETILTLIDVAKCCILFCNDNGSYQYTAGRSVDQDLYGVIPFYLQRHFENAFYGNIIKMKLFTGRLCHNDDLFSRSEYLNYWQCLKFACVILCQGF